ncbi:MAG: NUDIX domain-containing protein [Pseudomonadota bacterium]
MRKKTIIKKLFHLWFLIRRPITLGVRVLIENKDGEILLVRHTYVDGWYLPGGGVETGETAEQAARKELLEEAGVKTNDKAKLLGIYFNSSASKRDHVVLYRFDDWIDTGQFHPNKEIAEIGFFSIDALPVGTTPATRQRILEVYENHPNSELW